MEITKDGNNILHILMEEDDTLFITTENISTVVKHNDIGVSIDHYQDGEEEPFDENQVFFA